MDSLLEDIYDWPRAGVVRALTPSVIREWNNACMNDNLDVFHDNNEVSKKDAIDSLIEFASLIKVKPRAKVIEVGCADGVVSDILFQHLPSDIELLLSCDKNEKAIPFARERYQKEKMMFRVLDIEEDLPEELKGKFDNFFSFMTFHWVPEQEKAFRNVYDLLNDDGECFLTLKGYSQIHQMFLMLSRTKKWGPYMTGMKQFLSPYYDVSNPDQKMKDILKNIGFKNVHVKSTQKVYTFKKAETYRNLMIAVNPFKVPEEETEHYFDDLMEVTRTMGMIDENNGSLTFVYNMNIIHCTK